MSVTRWRKPCREQYLTHEYFNACQNEVSDVVYTTNSDGVCVRMDHKDVVCDSADDSADWIPLSDLPGKVNNRKNGHGGRRIVLALRQLKEKYLSGTENLTEDDSSGLLADNSSNDDQ